MIPTLMQADINWIKLITVFAIEIGAEMTVISRTRIERTD